MVVPVPTGAPGEAGGVSAGDAAGLGSFSGSAKGETGTIVVPQTDHMAKSLAHAGHSTEKERNKRSVKGFTPECKSVVTRRSIARGIMLN